MIKLAKKVGSKGIPNMERPNDHVVESIKNYASLNHSPYFALMITGPWGVGKTHLVKSTFNKLNNINYSYISLYGISSNDDIDIAILQSLNPILSSSTAKAVGRVGKAALKYLRIDGVVKPGDFVKPNQEYIYIFDDLERCSMPPEAALGYINEFVEHDGCKVIIIANEEELPDRDSFKDTKEKLIGRTIEVQPDTEHLVENLISQIRNQRTKSLLDESRKIICTIFSEANTKSFRVLQQAIWDFENLADLLDKNHFENRDGITATLRLFLAMALEFKSGELSKQDIIDRPSSMLRAFKRDQPPKNHHSSPHKKDSRNLISSIQY